MQAIAALINKKVDKNKKICDNKDFFFDNSTGMPMDAAEMMTAEAKRLRN